METYTAKVVKAKLKINGTQLGRLVAAGKIEAIKPERYARKHFYRASDVDRLEAEQQQIVVKAS